MMELPLIDFSRFSLDEDSSKSAKVREPNSDQIAVAKEIGDANRKHGFVLLRNSGIPKDLLQTTFDQTKSLFDLDDEYKLKHLKQWDHVTNCGYSGIGSEALNRRRKPDQKEAFNFRDVTLNSEEDNDDENGASSCCFSTRNHNRQKETNKNYQNTPHHFEEVTQTFWKAVKYSGMKYAQCCAISLDLPRDYFSSTFQKFDLCTVRLLYYPPYPKELLEEKENHDEGKASIRLGEHTDFGAFTFLFVNDFESSDSEGLQVKGVTAGEDFGNHSNNQNEEWCDVIFSQDVLEKIKGDETATVIVNTGALIARWTNDSWPATAHRVIVTQAALSKSRYSVACFFDPDKDEICEVNEKFLSDGEEPKYEPISSIDYLSMKIKEAQKS